MDRAYYKQYRELELKHWWFRGRECILSNILKSHTTGSDSPTDTLKVLNVGAATGRTSEWLSGFGDVESIEPDESCARMAEEYTGMTITVASAEALPYDADQFDVVTAFDVIEHIEDDHQAVRELFRVTRPGGIVFVTVPAFTKLWSKHDVINHHFRRYDRGQLRQLFLQEEIIRSGYFNFFLLPPIAAARAFSKSTQDANQADLDEIKSDFDRNQSKLISGILEKVLRFEAAILSNKDRFPLGVSEYLIARKGMADS
ncbi:MAG: class I SAM-dependent methyltransferase [Verrucomicrobiales bacterium]|nr:class I SAM-dependent methyltransferase [Verrucomicrobiales bacterium]